MEHGPSQRFQGGVTLQEPPGEKDGDHNAKRRFLSFDRLQALLPQRRTQRGLKKLCADMGRSRCMDKSSIPNNKTSSSESEHSSIWRKRCSQNNGEAPKTSRRTAAYGESAERTHDGRGCRDGGVSARTNRVNEAFNSNCTGPRSSSELEEIDVPPASESNILRANMVIKATSSVPRKKKSTRNTVAMQTSASATNVNTSCRPRNLSGPEKREREKKVQIVSSNV